MNTKQAILSNLNQSDFFASAYLADLTDKDLLARACPGGNHIAWQLGHLIQTEQYFASQFAPGNAPVLPGEIGRAHV